VTESEFWDSLEFRVCREFDAMPECQKRGLWCDGFLPRTYKVTKRRPYIAGTAWIGIGPRHQEQWEFVLLLGQAADRPGSILWDELLPAENRTGWVTVDLEEKKLVMEPRRAVRGAP